MTAAATHATWTYSCAKCIYTVSARAQVLALLSNDRGPALSIARQAARWIAFVRGWAIGERTVCNVCLAAMLTGPLAERGAWAR